MFRDVVSNLSLSPAATSQLAFYWRRLKREQLTRQLSMVTAGALVLLQVAMIVAPPDAATAGSDNDIIYGGIGTSSSQHNLLQVYDQDKDAFGHGGYHQLFAHFGIDRNDLANTVHGTIVADAPSKKHPDMPILWSAGRETHSALDEPFTAGGKTTYYLRPLYTWGDGASYPALIGHRHGDGAWFAVIDGCGNIVVQKTPPPEIVSEKPQPSSPGPSAPTKTPTTNSPIAPSTPTSPPSSPPQQPINRSPKIEQSKSALLTPAAGGPARNANGATAQAGDVIEYTLTTTNSGDEDAKNYEVRDNINDILEYAQVIDPRGGTVGSGVISWPQTTIKAGQSFLTTFQVRVKSPIPITPRSASDPQSFDLRMDDVYGNLVSVNLVVPPQKQIETASATLPQTGTGTDTLIVFLLVGAIAYFYLRNRQLVTEIGILRSDHHGPAGHGTGAGVAQTSNSNPYNPGGPR